MVERVVVGVAAGVGYALRVLLVLASWLPTFAAYGLVLYGTWLIYRPACYILAGLLMIAQTAWRGALRR